MVFVPPSVFSIEFRNGLGFRKVRTPGAGVVGIRVERKSSADAATLLRSAKKKDYFAAGA